MLKELRHIKITMMLLILVLLAFIFVALNIGVGRSNGLRSQDQLFDFFALMGVTGTVLLTTFAHCDTANME